MVDHRFGFVGNVEYISSIGLLSGEKPGTCSVYKKKSRSVLCCENQSDVSPSSKDIVGAFSWVFGPIFDENLVVEI